MNVKALRKQIEPFLSSKGCEGSTRENYRSFVKLYIDFLETSRYEEMSDESIDEYMKPYKGKSLENQRKKRVEDFREYVKGQMNMANQIVNDNETDQDMANADMANILTQRLTKRGRKPKSENTDRTQISALIDNKIYVGIKALAFVSNQPLSELIAKILKAFYEDNYEAITASAEIMKQSEIAKSKIKLKY